MIVDRRFFIQNFDISDFWRLNETILPFSLFVCYHKDYCLFLLFIFGKFTFFCSKRKKEACLSVPFICIIYLCYIKKLDDKKCFN